MENEAHGEEIDECQHQSCRTDEKEVSDRSVKRVGLFRNLCLRFFFFFEVRSRTAAAAQLQSNSIRVRLAHMPAA